MGRLFDELAVRSARRQRSRHDGAEAADLTPPDSSSEPWIGRLSRGVAQPVSRRQALSWLGKMTAVSTAALVGLWPDSAEAAFCQPGLTDCGSLDTHPDCCTSSQACCDVTGRGGFCYDPTINYCDGDCGPIGFDVQCCGPGSAGPTGTTTCLKTEKCCTDTTGFTTCCPPGQFCVARTCTTCPKPCGANCCSAEEDCCNGSCTRIGTPTNCFTCGHVCDQGQACCESFPGSGTFNCQNLNDPNHCGACNNKCTGADADCCHQICINTATNAANCGACDRPCGLNKICCNKVCIDPLTDVNNCIDCGRVCPAGQICTRSGCCQPCGGGSCCPEGQECKNGKCKKKPRIAVAA
jgi:hypothetical protein